MELPRAVLVVVAVPLPLVVEFSTCAASCQRHMDDGAPAVAKQEAGQTPVGCVALRRPDALLVHAIRLHSASGEELDVTSREGRCVDVGEGAHVRG